VISQHTEEAAHLLASLRQLSLLYTHTNTATDTHTCSEAENTTCRDSKEKCVLSEGETHELDISAKCVSAL